MTHTFQVHLRGIIDLLSEHLYSGPQVYIRELLQNAVDAITARRQQTSEDFHGEITIECHGASSGRPAVLSLRDNGIGLTLDEIHTFLATIGHSSKRADNWQQPSSFLGQFGIGILSCFVVTDEITVLTKSAREPSSPGVEWRARSDGSYTVRLLESDWPVGTQVWLQARPERERWLAPDEVRRLVIHYGRLLPYPLHFQVGSRSEILNPEPPPWRRRYAYEAQYQRALLEYGQQEFGISFLDAIPLHLEQAGGLEGVAYVLPVTPRLSGRQKGHRIYLKNMFLCESADNLLPDWAFFVRVVVNVNHLRPTAAREGFYEDEDLSRTRAAIGACLRRYLLQLAEHNPERLERFIQLHHRALKALAAEDDEFCAIILDHLPFETSLGRMTFGEYRRQHQVVRYVSDVDTFRQLATVAAAQNLCILNAGYAYDLDLLAQVPNHYPNLTLEEITSDSLTHEFADLSSDEEEACQSLLAQAEKTLQPFYCRVEIRKFHPDTVPALYSISREGRFQRQLEQTRAISNSLWSGVLEGLAQRELLHSGTLCLNYRNPLIQRLAALPPSRCRQCLIEVLYVQALLLGHHPLNSREWQLFHQGLTAWIDELMVH